MSNIFNPSCLFTQRINKRLQLFPRTQSRFITAASSVLVPNQQQVAHLLLEQKTLDQVLQTFQWASKIPGFSHNLSTYRALIHKLCTFRQFKIVEQMLDEMPKRLGSYPDEDIFVTIVRGLGRARMTRQVTGVLDLVVRFGEAAPSLKLLNTILDVLVKEDIDIARKFYRRKMMGCGMKGDNYTYGILMKGFCLTNRIGEGFKLLQVMKSHGVKVNVVVYNTLIYALCKNRKVGRARSLMNEMEEYSDVTYNILISAYCNENNLVQALVMFEKCFKDGFMPDIVTLTKLLEILCSARRASEAVEILERVEKKRGPLDVVAYNTLLKGFVQSEKIKAARGFLKQMEMKGCLPNTDTYNILIKGFCDSEMFESALDMFDEMKRAGVHWDFITFDTLIYRLCSSGKTRDGLKIFQIMLEGNRKDCVHHIGPYNSILYGLYKENRLDEVPKLLNYMKALFPHAASRSLSILQSCEDGNIDEAKQILDKMHEEGDIPSALVYANLIRGFCENRRMKEGIKLMNEMIGRGYIPIGSTFNFIISGFCGQCKVGAGLRLLEDLKMRGCSLDSGSYGDIIRAFCIKGDLVQAVMLLMQMVEGGIAPDYFTWSMLLFVVFEEKNKVSDQKLLQWLTET